MQKIQYSEYLTGKRKMDRTVFMISHAIPQAVVVA